MSGTHDQEAHEGQDEITLMDEHGPESTLKSLDSLSSPTEPNAAAEVTSDQEDESTQISASDNPFGSPEEIDDFGDFGKTETSTAAGGEDDEFGAFGSTEDAFQNGTVDGGDDDDGFGDFGEVHVAGAEGDDDFGDFNDFADGDGFQDSGDFGDFEGTTATNGENDPFGASESVPTAPSPVPEEFSVEVKKK